jgi:hypothetical protein
MFKVYESRIYIKRSINIEVNGKPRVIDFIGGLKYPKKVFGRFVTSNAAEQKALEDHPGFGKKFILKSEEVDKTESKEEVILAEETVDKERKTVVVDETVTTDNASEASPEMFGNKIVEKEAAVIPEATKEEVIKEVTEPVVEEVAEEVTEVIPEAGQEEVAPATKEVVEEVIESPKVVITEVVEVEKVQQGKEYLMKKFPNEFVHRQLSNKIKVLEAAKEKNISFPNIP